MHGAHIDGANLNAAGRLLLRMMIVSLHSSRKTFHLGEQEDYEGTVILLAVGIHLVHVALVHTVV